MSPVCSPCGAKVRAPGSYACVEGREDEEAAYIEVARCGWLLHLTANGACTCGCGGEAAVSDRSGAGKGKYIV